MENLNKENFFNEIQQNFPDAFNLFGDWIDKYKAEVGWHELFGNRMRSINEIKFHDLPFEMQNGIIARFDIECYGGIFTGKGNYSYEQNRTTYVENMKSLFADVQKMLKIQKG